MIQLNGRPYLPVTPEELQGTRTVYLPLRREDGISPQVTLVFKREEGNRFAVGFSVCSRVDAFIKVVGRTQAGRRLIKGKNHFLVDTATQLHVRLVQHLLGINQSYPSTVSHAVFEDLAEVLRDLNKRFTKMEEATSEKKVAVKIDPKEFCGC